MLLVFLFSLCFLTFSIGLVLSASILLAMWLSFGRTNVFFRMPLFLLGTLPIGLIFCLAEINEYGYAFLVLVLLCVTAWLFGQFHAALKVSVGVMIAMVLWLSFANPMSIDWHNLNAAWFSRVALGTSLIAATFSALKLFFSFNVTRLVDDANDMEIEQKTGKSLDAWLTRLQSDAADDWKHADIMSYLRTYGIDFDWQKRITLAYRKTTGSYSVGKGFNGKNQVVDSGSTSKNRKRFWGFSMQQLGVWQLILLTFCVACLFRFTDGVSGYIPSQMEVAIAVPILLALSVYVIGLLFGCLSVGQFHTRRLATVLGCGFLFFMFTCVAEQFIFTGGRVPLIFALLLTSLSTILIGVLVRARHRTYRIVKVQQAIDPETNLIASVDDWEQYRDKQNDLGAGHEEI